jgi:predicted DNA repair protein MutK
MLWVGGGILVHGLVEIGLAAFIPHAIEDLGHRAGASAGQFSALVAWTVSALGGAVVGLVVGGIIAMIVRRFTKRPEELIVD